ncbi:MFS transporter [Croceicoccus ponticola]|uniref:MFS transporter n=1 Tax=Croceicoccus ponticola TaxID=2217664 RepID=A0A437GZM6_9SPHN|nr:MFS transporter [Croceicoccus ponticola]RVQ68789.1 MFS transporter [Croceicoccus ponticola]
MASTTLPSTPVTPVAPVPSAKGYAWYVAFLLATAHLVSFIDRYLMSLVMEPLKADLGVSDTQLGLLQGTGFVILYTVVAVPLGRAADSFNRRNLIIAGILIWSVATALCGLASSFGGLFAARVAVGFGEAALVPAAMSLLAAYFPRRQLGRAVSLFTTGASLGKSAALIGGGALLALLTSMGGLSLGRYGTLAPWQGTFVLMAIPGIVLAALMLTAKEPARTVAQHMGAVAKPGIGEAWRYVVRHRAAFLLHTGASALVVLTIQSIAAWATSFYVRFFALTPSQAGIAIGSVILIAAPLGHLSGGALTDWFQSRRSRSPAAPVIVIGMAGAIPAVILFVASPSLPLSLFAYGLLSFSVTLAAPASLAGIQMLAPDRLRGVVTSMFLAVTTLVGIGLGPMLVGLFSDLAGGPLQLGRALLSMIVVVAVIAIILALASRRPFERTAALTAAAN